MNRLRGRGQMIRRILHILLISFSFVFLIGCDLGGLIENDTVETGEQDQHAPVLSLEELEETANFRDGALGHILEGELNGSGKAVGFHYDGLPTKKGEVIAGTETDPNQQGVYEAEVVVSGVEKVSNGGKSTFFPKEWNAQEVVDAINEAYDAKQFITGNTYEGITSGGQIIRMYVDHNDLIISAFPVY